MTLGYAGQIYSLEFLPDGQLASGNWTGEILLWDVVTGKRVRNVQAHRNGITSLSASQSKLASGSSDKTVRLWDTTSWHCISTFDCVSAVASVALYPNGDRVACIALILGDFGIFYVWDTENQRMVAFHELSGHNVAVSNDGKWLAVTRKNTTLGYDALSNASGHMIVGVNSFHSRPIALNLCPAQLTHYICWMFKPEIASNPFIMTLWTEQSSLTMAHAFSQVSHAPLLCEY